MVPSVITYYVMTKSSDDGSGSNLSCSDIYNVFAFQNPTIAKRALAIVTTSKANGDTPASQKPNTLASPVLKIILAKAPSRS